MKDRKWKLAKWAFLFGVVVAVAGLVGWFVEKDGAAGIIVQGLGLIGTVLALYGAANVAQKQVTSKYYQPIKDETNDSTEAVVYDARSNM